MLTPLRSPLWFGWELGSRSSGNDRFDVVATNVGVSLVVEGAVEVEWRSSGKRRTVPFTAGMSDFRPVDGQTHTYRNRWHDGSSAFCLEIPPEHLALARDEEEIQGGTGEGRHLFGFHDGVVEECMRCLAVSPATGIDALDREWVGRRLLLRLLELQGSAPAPWSTRKRRMPAAAFDRVEAFIHDRLSERIALADIAKAAGMSPGHFARSFRRSTGVSPGQYVRLVRVQKAFERIATGGDPLDAIARSSGFASQSHMCQVFVRVLGITPGYARRRGLRPVDVRI